jgi:CBS domain-containing protein
MKSIRSIIGDRDTVTVDINTTVTDAARIMARRQIGAVAVTNDGRLAGIFSERDVLNRVVAAGQDPATLPVGDVMTSNLIVAEVGESYEACLLRMREAHVRHLIVLNQGSLAGIVSLRDLMDVDLDEKAEAITLLNAYVHYIPADLQTKVRT